MRIALYSPLPPCKSGIADYSATLLPHLRQHADVLSVTESTPESSPGSTDVALYQIGNNPHHIFAYEAALRQPGVVVLHEANLHHLVADMTIKRGQWDRYMQEVEFDGGPAALAYAQRVRALEVGPDYDGVPMLRRVLQHSRAAITHSAYVQAAARQAGFTGPIGVIPHGAWLAEGDRMGYRSRLGIGESTPLIGIFGHLKPYKRIAESLRAFRRVWRAEPAARLLLVGEPHPDLPLEPLLRGLGIEEAVHLIGYTELDDFNGYIAACDVVLNLRYPTVGETSGTLLRAFGMGKPTLISDVGSFHEFPGDICLKIPVDHTEEDHLFEALHLLVTRPQLARGIGGRARQWVEENGSWERVAGLYASFLESVQHGTEWTPESAAPVPAKGTEATAPASPLVVPQPTATESDWASYVQGWVDPRAEAQAYLATHLTRLVRTLELTPPGEAGKRVLEMGSYMQITPALQHRLGYGEVRGCYYGPAGSMQIRHATFRDGQTFTCQVELFDAERDLFPYPDEYFHTVLCCELLEHLPSDPMWMMREINRITAPGGHLLLTTPNIASLRAIAAILQGYHPGFFPSYIAPDEGGQVDPRHAREYAPREIAQLLQDSGFTLTHLETGPFQRAPHPEWAWVSHLLERYELPQEWREEGIYALGRKTGPPGERYPAWLYYGRQ